MDTGVPSCTKSVFFFNIVQKARDPPPPFVLKIAEQIFFDGYLKKCVNVCRDKVMRKSPSAMENPQKAVSQKRFFQQKKIGRYPYVPLWGLYKAYPKAFFCRTSLEGEKWGFRPSKLNFASVMKSLMHFYTFNAYRTLIFLFWL